MKHSKFALGALALALVAGNAHAIPLTTLLNSGSIQAGDKLFDRWSVTFDDSSNGQAVDTNNIDVVALNDGGLNPGPGLTFNINNNEFSVTGDGVYAYRNFVFGFRTTVLDPTLLIKDNSLSMVGEIGGFVSDAGMAIAEQVTNASNNVVASENVESSMLAGFGTTQLLNDAANFAPLSELWITKNILVWATDVNETATLTSFSQRFSQQNVQVPEPAILGLFALGFVGMGLVRRGQKSHT